MNNLSVSDFNRFNGEIMAETSTGQHVINELDFERFLRRSGRMNFFEGISKGSDNTVTGQCSMEEYWVCQKEYHTEDIAEYLVRCKKVMVSA